MENINFEFLAVLLGIAVGIFGQKIITYKSAKVIRKIYNTNNFEQYAPFVLSFIAVFALIEYWRVTSTININNQTVNNKDSFEAWTLYIDLLLFLFVFISLGGYKHAISLFSEDDDGNAQDFIDNTGKPDFSKVLARSTFFLGIFLFIGLGRYMLTILYVDKLNFQKLGEQAIAHILGIILCLIACLFFRKDKLKAGFVCSTFGLVVVIAYFVFNNVL